MIQPLNPAVARQYLEHMARAWFAGNTYPLPFEAASSLRYLNKMTRSTEEAESAFKAEYDRDRPFPMPYLSKAYPQAVDMLETGEVEHWAQCLLSPMLESSEGVAAP